MSDNQEWIEHWISRPHGPNKYRSAAHTLIVDAASQIQSGQEEEAMDRLRIAADMLVKSNDSESGVYDPADSINTTK